jgi:hypothetical protein
MSLTAFSTLTLGSQRSVGLRRYEAQESWNRHKKNAMTLRLVFTQIHVISNLIDDLRRNVPIKNICPLSGENLRDLFNVLVASTR